MYRTNPLREFKRAHPGVTWEELSAATGTGKWTLQLIMKKRATDVPSMTIGTYLRIKKVTGVDMLAWYNETVGLTEEKSQQESL